MKKLLLVLCLPLVVYGVFKFTDRGARPVLRKIIKPSMPVAVVQHSNAEFSADEKLLRLWQKREGLEGWSIYLRVVRRAEIPHLWGENTWNLEDRTSDIRILCAADFAEFYSETPAEIRADTEETIIHELMHLVLAPLGTSESQSRAVNVATEALSQMLFRRRVPGGLSETRYINRVISAGPWHPLTKVKRSIMLQVIHAMNATAEDDTETLLATSSVPVFHNPDRSRSN